MPIESVTSGDQVLLNGNPAEIIRVYEVGSLTYVRAYVEGEGVKSVCIDHVEIEPRQSTFNGDPSQDPEDLSAERFDLRTQAVRFQLAHQRGQLLSITNSLVRLEPYQLACVNEVMRKLRQRVLIADDVGLGKTIEAGLILKELDARRRADRVLFIVPAHLQKKWVREMKRFFDIHLVLADRAWVEGERRRLGEEANIWNQGEQRLITSMAFLRQQRFTRALEEPFWDVVVVDEAHKASKKGQNPSQTSKRVEQVTQQSDALLLLSATPHSGKEQSFRSLISYIDPFRVAQEQELTREVVREVMIRRGKETIFDDHGNRIFPKRDVQTVGLEMTTSERSFYDAVTDYVRTLYNRSDALNKPVVGFAMALMQKRLVSSLGAIRATLKRRLDGLLEHDQVQLSEMTRGFIQGDDLEEADQIQAEHELERITITGDKALKDEIEALRHLLKMAERITIDSKARKVRQFIQSLLEDQPSEKILLFTEYRDTLDYVLELCSNEPWYDEIMVIHGDVDKERRAQIEQAFNFGSERLLFATDAASEGIDLQKKCHIMINYELPWNPNRLEQRIGRIHRYGQEREVKVLNFQFAGTRESKIFELLQTKIENIRERVGATADVLGLVEDLDVERLIMRSLHESTPEPVSERQLELELEQREQTLMDWYQRSLIDCSTFDAESRAKIQQVVDDSEDIFGSEQDIQRFVVSALRALGGKVDRVATRIFKVKVPDVLADTVAQDFREQQVTFDRDLAMQFENELGYLAPDHPLVRSLVKHIVERQHGFGGEAGWKALPFLERPGITFNYRMAFEDGTGEVLREELCPVHVDLESQHPNRKAGQRVVEGEAIAASYDPELLRMLGEHKDQLQTKAEAYLSRTVEQIQQHLLSERQAQTTREIEGLDAYASAERERLASFIESYREQQAAGADMEIAIRGQQKRMRNLASRIQDRKDAVRAKGQVISLAPELVNWCFAVPA